MATRRLYVDSSRATVAKPGFDAEFPPAVDYLYLSMDSRLSIVKPLEIGLVPTASYNATINFTQNYGFIPAVDLFLYNGGSVLQSLVIRDANSSVAYQRTPFYPVVTTSSFQVTDERVYVASAAFNGTWSLYYVAWQVP